MKPILFIILSISLSSIPLLATPSSPDDLISLFIEYRHNSVHVNETLNCTYEKMCFLNSQPGKKPTWRIELVPHRRPNGLASVSQKAFENGKLEQKSTFQLRVGGDSASILVEKSESDRHEVTVAALAPNQVQGSR